MCGIFGFKIVKNSQFLQDEEWKSLLRKLFFLSQSRGKEASGLAILRSKEISILRSNQPAEVLLKTSAYKDLLKPSLNVTDDLVLMGHTRLVTNGAASFLENNQPVNRDDITLIHNGIICNFEDLWKKLDSSSFKRKTELDSEVIAAFLRNELNHGKSLEEAVKSFYNVLEGDASIACLFKDKDVLLLSTNTGSLYCARSLTEDSFVFASEKGILDRLLATSLAQRIFKGSQIQRLSPGEILQVSFTQQTPSPQELSSIKIKTENPIEKLKRCSKCILPETFPGIEFDSSGICNICKEYIPYVAYGKDKLEDLCSKYRKKDGTPDCIVALSGGRDSSFALHYLKKEMGMNPIAFTYDWGMVTDLARRNISRLCGQLGVEHILVSANIPQKREFIRQNVQAWLKDPQLGMVTLFMAGDKEFFYHYRKIKQDMNIDLVFFASNRLEQSGFKSGFCGAVEKNGWFAYVPIAQKLKMLRYFALNFLKNPAYINKSLFNSLFSFYCAYVLKHDFRVFFDYIAWDEKQIMDVLKQEYNWEMAVDTSTSWRIGDGTAAFYYYIYYKLAGFSEHDTFLSNQIRSGMINRDEALESAQKNNVARLDSIHEYASLIGFDGKELIKAVEKARPLYAI